MKYGVILPNFGPQAAAQELVDTAHEAERLGYDSVWTTDHVAVPRADSEVYGQILEALMALAYVAAATRRIRLGVSSLVLPQRDPVLAAKQMAALDFLSGGRAMLCVGVGWSAGEYANLGRPFQDRGRRLDEAIPLLRLLWGTDDPAGLTFAGQYSTLHEAIFAPRPPQGSALPIWVGGNSPAAIRRAAELGDGWHPTRLSEPEFRRGVSTLRSRTRGRTLTVSLRIRLAFGGEARPAMLAGSSARITEQLLSYIDAGLEYPVLAFEAPHPAGRREAMARFMDEIAPVLPGAPGT